MMHLSSIRWMRCILLFAWIVLIALAAGEKSPSAQEGTTPFAARMLSWAELIEQVRASGCVTSNTTLLQRHRPGSVCRRPIMVLSRRASDCPSCDSLQYELETLFGPEWRVAQDYVTIVDAGDPVINAVLRTPYPLPLPFSVEEELSSSSRAPGSLSLHPQLQGAEKAETEDMALRMAEQELSRRVARLVNAPSCFGTHAWDAVLRASLAGQGEYLFRAFFLYPHNGSVMREVYNADVEQGSDANIHFYFSAEPFMKSVLKAVRVMEHVVAMHMQSLE